MMAIATTSSWLCYPHLLLAIALALCLFTPDRVQSQKCSTPRSDDDLAIAITYEHNYYRSGVIPDATNMRRMYWSREMANIASINACGCNYFVSDAPATRLSPGRRLWARENHGIRAVGKESLSEAVFQIIRSWNASGEEYRFMGNAVNGRCGEGNRGRGQSGNPGRGGNPGEDDEPICEHYIQMVWAWACEVGCAVRECLNSELDPSSENPTASSYLLVCAYGPRFPNTVMNSRRPYQTGGTSCEHCPNGFRECDTIDVPTYATPPAGTMAMEDVGNLCYSEDGARACIGSDPHFAIMLAGGSLLCYTFQGLPNTTFNLVGNNQLVMNAHFVPDDTAWDNTWLGSIGMVIFHEGKKMTTLQFIAADQLVRIGERVRLDAKTLEQMTFNKGKLMIREAPFNHTPTYPRIRVKFLDSGLNFIIKFAKNNHLNLYWHSTGVPHKHSKGILGQFFRDGVDLDVDKQLLHVPGRPPVPVEQQELWKFMEQSFHGDSKCWTTAYHSSQGAGIVAGNYKDYIVEDLLSTEY